MKKAGYIAVLFCLAATIPRFWIAEDAYITLRVVENFFYGLGPVFNAGERVEVYTHPTWFTLLIGLRFMGVSGPVAAAILSLVFLVLSLWFMVRYHAKAAVIPILFLTAFPGFRDFALSGLEYPLVFFLLVLFYLELDRTRLSDRPFYFFSLLALLYLTRPELGLMGAFYGFYLCFELILIDKHRSDRQRLQTVLLAISALLLIAGTWHLLRFSYYGVLFPNTYYAKAGMSAYYVQGMKYLTHSVLFGPAVLLFFAIVGIYIWKTYQMADGFSDPLFFSVIRETVLIFLLCFYVIRLGGDFMAFRFMLPVVTILALFSMRYLKLIFDEGWLGSKTEKVLIQFGFVTAFALLWIPVPISKGYIADERAHFVKDFKPEASLFSKFLSYFDAASHPWGKAGAEMKELQSCLSYDPFIVANSQAEARCRSGMGLGYSGYAAGPEVNIIDEQGISDFYVARLPVPVRFRPGHEHSIGTYEILEKKVLFCHTGDAFYDEVMSTPYGVLVRLDEQLIATLPDARDRLQKLMVLKQKRSAGLEMVEHFSETSVENLLQKSNRWNQNWNFISRHDCWNSKK